MKPDLKSILFNAAQLLLLLAIVLAVLLPYCPAWYTFPGRDSGVFLYTGWRILHGAVPYLQVWDHKPPVIYYLNALGLALNPDSTWGVWLVEIVSLWVSAALAYSLLKRLYGIFPAIFCSFLWPLTAFYLLAGGNLTNEYALPFQFALLWFFQRAESRPKYGWNGIAIGALTALLFFTRQNAVGIAVAIGLYLLVSRLWHRQFRQLFADSLSILIGGLTGTALIVGYFAFKAALPAFWDIAFVYNFLYSEERNTADRLNALAQGLNQLENIGLAQIAFLGWGSALALLGFKKERLHPQARPLLWLCLLALPVEIGMVSIGGRPRIPYFLTLLPVFALCSGFTIWLIFDSLLKDVPRYVGALLTLLMVFSLGSVMFADYTEIVQGYIQPSDGQGLVTYITQNSSPQDAVLMWGAESTYNFLARRTSPSRYVYQVPLFKLKDKPNTSQFLNDILTNRPRLIIMADTERLSDFRFAYRDNDIGALMDQVKTIYQSKTTLGSWVIYTYSNP